MADSSPTGWRFANDAAATALCVDGLAADAVAALATLGERVEAEERRSWNAERFVADGAKDRRVAGLWAAVASGSPWADRDAWEALLRPDLRRQVHALAHALNLPADRRKALDDDLGEALFYLLVGSDGRVAGFAELAVRTLETLPPGPVDGLSPFGDDDVWHTLAACAVGHGEWPGTLAARWPALGRGATVAALRTALAAPGGAEWWIDLHCARRAAVHLRAGHPDPWSVVVQNRGRARARLRARLAADAAAMAAAVAAVPAVATRTLAAWRRLCWAWVQAQARAHGERDALAGVTPPCPAVPRPRLAEDPALRTWLLLAIVRGQYDRVVRWVGTGSTGDGDSSFGRLLVSLPDHLADVVGDSRRTYHTVRAELASALPRLCMGLTPVLADLADAPDSATVSSILQRAWAGKLPRPTSRLGEVPARAAAVLGNMAPLPVAPGGADA